MRDPKPQRRHEVLLAIFDELGADERFVLVNDHDPKPLYHQFEGEAGPEFRWEYRRREPGEFRVLIGKSETTTGQTDDPETRAPF